MFLCPDTMAHCYDMVIAASPTLQGWNLPPSEDVKFKVTKHKMRYGHHEVISGVHHIAMSKINVTSFQTLISTMVHEQVHIHQDQTGLPRSDDKAFEKFADRLCSELGLDRGAF